MFLPGGIQSFNGFFSLWNFKYPELHNNVNNKDSRTVFAGCDAIMYPNLKEQEKLFAFQLWRSHIFCDWMSFNPLDETKVVFEKTRSRSIKGSTTVAIMWYSSYEKRKISASVDITKIALVTKISMICVSLIPTFFGRLTTKLIAQQGSTSISDTNKRTKKTSQLIHW